MGFLLYKPVCKSVCFSCSYTTIIRWQCRPQPGLEPWEFGLQIQQFQVGGWGEIEQVESATTSGNGARFEDGWPANQIKGIALATKLFLSMLVQFLLKPALNAPILLSISV